MKTHFIFLHQSAKLRFIIKNAKTIFLRIKDKSVFSGNGDICNTNLTLMATSYLNAFFRRCLNHHYTFLFITHTFDDQISTFWLIDTNHLLQYGRLLWACCHLHIACKLSLAYLAFEFLEIVMLSSPDHFFFYFNSYPLYQTIKVNSSARTVAFAWVE